MLLHCVNHKNLSKIFSQYLIVFGISSIGPLVLIEDIFLNDGLSVLHAVLGSETAHEGFIHKKILHYEK